MNKKCTAIEIGDEVIVVFNDGDKICGTVVYIPISVGDYWIIKDAVNLYYCQTFKSIVARLDQEK